MLVIVISLCLLVCLDIEVFSLEQSTEARTFVYEMDYKRSLRDSDSADDKHGSEIIAKDAGKNENKESTKDRSKWDEIRSRIVKEEEGADNSLVGTFSPDPYHEVDSMYEVTESIGLVTVKKSAYEDAFNDKEWKSQWYMHDYRKTNGPVMDLNIVPVHKMGYNGQGITVAVVDTGVDMDHPDLKKNLDVNLQYNVQYDTRDGNPVNFQGGKSEKSSHGTKTAGIIAMVANNSLCGVGMAYKANIVAVNMMSAYFTPYHGAKALLHGYEYVDISTNSWGPRDSGKSMRHLTKPIADAFDRGIQRGRGGLGTIFVFSGGNGREKGEDNCSADEIVNYLNTIVITGADQNGKRAEFSEECSAIFATTYSGSYKSEGVVAPLNTGPTSGACTNEYSGKSASTPQASAIIALILQANKGLTYRDVMHVITMGAEVAPLADNDSWYQNGAGFWVSNEFGFGLMNAYNMVRLAIGWVNVPEKEEPCEVIFKIPENLIFRINEPVSITQLTDACQESGGANKGVRYLEQIILTSSIAHRFRGAISITLTSPRGTKTEVLSPRPKDRSHIGLIEWRSKSVHNWGEDPKGEWKIDVSAQFVRVGLSKLLENLYQTFAKPLMLQRPDYYETGTVKSFTLWLHGTSAAPDHHKKRLVPRTYSAFRTGNGKKSDPRTKMQRREGGLRTHTLHESQKS